jgi:hypothetical protein
VKSSALKHKIYACKVCLKRKAEDVNTFDHEKKDLKRYPSSTLSIHNHKHTIAKEKGGRLANMITKRDLKN